MKFPQLHQNLSLCVFGDRRLGKTELCKVMCLKLSLMYLGSNAYFIYTTTVDALRHHANLMAPGVPILLDDMQANANDDGRGQLIYSDVSMWKALLQIENPTQVRSRNKDVQFAMRQPKFIISNCKDSETFVSGLAKTVSERDQAALLERCAEVCVVGRLYANEAGPPADTSALLQPVMSFEDALHSVP